MRFLTDSRLSPVARSSALTATPFPRSCAATAAEAFPPTARFQRPVRAGGQQEVMPKVGVTHAAPEPFSEQVERMVGPDIGKTVRFGVGVAQT